MARVIGRQILHSAKNENTLTVWTREPLPADSRHEVLLEEMPYRTKVLARTLRLELEDSLLTHTGVQKASEKIRAAVAEIRADGTDEEKKCLNYLVSNSLTTLSTFTYDWSHMLATRIARWLKKPGIKLAELNENEKAIKEAKGELNTILAEDGITRIHMLDEDQQTVFLGRCAAVTSVGFAFVGAYVVIDILEKLSKSTFIEIAFHTLALTAILMTDLSSIFAAYTLRYGLDMKIKD